MILTCNIQINSKTSISDVCIFPFFGGIADVADLFFTHFWSTSMVFFEKKHPHGKLLCVSQSVIHLGGKVSNLSRFHRISPRWNPTCHVRCHILGGSGLCSGPPALWSYLAIPRFRWGIPSNWDPFPLPELPGEYGRSHAASWGYGNSMGNSTSQMATQNFGWPRERIGRVLLRASKSSFSGGGWLLVLGRVLTQHESEHRL